MPEYRRNRVPGGTYFFNVNPADRRSDLLVREIETLRTVRQNSPFHIDAWVVLPDHMHCIWTHPEGDTDYSCHCSALEARFAKAVATGRARSPDGRRGRQARSADAGNRGLRMRKTP